MKNKIYITIILVVAIVLVANLISQSFFVRLDFSEDKQYTLNQATKDLLKNLPEPVTVKAYFSENLPPNVAQVRKDFKEMLIEFNNRSKGMLVYQFINPNEKEEIEQEAGQNGIQPIMINVREKDQMKQQKAYMGAVISMGEKKEIIPFVQPGSALEYSLAKALKKLSINEKPVIGLLQGHGEPSIQELVQVYNELSVLYNVEPVTLSDTSAIPDRVKTMMIIRPKDSIPSKHFAQLDNFIARGGKILIASSRVNADLQKAYGGLLSTGLESWLKTKGVILSDNIVVDAACSQVQVMQQQAGFQFATSIQFPYIPAVSNFAKHPIGGGLETVVMPFASTIEYNGGSSLKFTPIAMSSEKSNAEPLPVYFNVQKQWTDVDFPKQHLVLAATLEGKLNGTTDTKMVIIGNSDFSINAQQNQKLNADNVSLLANSIDWLSDETGFIELRTKAVTSRPIKELSDGTKTTLKWVNFLLPIILVVVYGFVRAQMKRNERIKRMEENYV